MVRVRRAGGTKNLLAWYAVGVRLARVPMPAKKKPQPKKSLKPVKMGPNPVKLLGDLRSIIEAGRGAVAQAVNAGLVMIYWEVGNRIRREILGEKRAKYGDEIVQTLSAQLTVEFGKGFSKSGLFSMIRFAEAFEDRRIVQTLSVQLGWSHFYQIIYFDSDLKRDFYAEMCRLERWSVRTLRDRIRGMMYERTAIAKKPEKVIRADLDALRDSDRLTPDLVFRDPYVLDFLRLPADFQEADLEQAILRELETFLLELGGEFAFVARQKRMTVDHIDYYLDLLFYHRRLRRLVAVELKFGSFTAADGGQMELYLRWLKKYECRDGEETPIALVLCAGKSDEHVEMLELEASGIRVAQYLSELPPRDALRRKLHDAIAVAKLRLETKSPAESP
jgi:predicted nuclease of restriction endonuclease-like (RecB) superfamily